MVGEVPRGVPERVGVDMGRNLAGRGANDERYTPREILGKVREVLGTIDCDPASCREAQELVGASVWYSKENDGLGKPWVGTVFLNPPYSRGLMWAFIRALIREREEGHCREAVVLLNNATETKAVQALLEEADGICLVSGRIAFRGSDLDGKTAGYQGSLMTYHGDNVSRFFAVMGELGSCWGRVSGLERKGKTR